jgi:thiol-disulfide isomerase/thioredoxin
MNERTPIRTTTTLVRVMLIFTASCLLLYYCSRPITPIQTNTPIELSPGLKKLLSSDIEEANPNTPGERFEITDCTRPGKFTIVEFYSLFSPACLDIEPKLELLARTRSDLAIRKLNIDRPEMRAIDLDSPLAKQFHITTLPEFKIFDQDDKLVAEGEAARREVELSILRDVSKKVLPADQSTNSPGH